MAMISGSGLFVAILAGAIAILAAAELKAWTPTIVRHLIEYAVARLPEHRRERFAEEWKSHVNDVPGTVGKLLVAAGFSIAAWNVAVVERQNQRLENLTDLLVRLDVAHVASTWYVSLHDDEETAEPVLRAKLNKVRSDLRKVSEQRKQLTTLVATASVAPRLFRNLALARADAIVRKNQSDKLLLQLRKHIGKACAQSVKVFQAQQDAKRVAAMRRPR